jgi:hypothetical protein
MDHRSRSRAPCQPLSHPHPCTAALADLSAWPLTSVCATVAQGSSELSNALTLLVAYTASGTVGVLLLRALSSGTPGALGVQSQQAAAEQHFA